MKIDNLTKQEKSLLLYLETVAVDHEGFINSQKINHEEIKILDKWDNEGFVLKHRASHEGYNGTVDLTHVIMLSDKAISIAHELRVNKIKQNIPEQFIKNR